MSNRSTVFDRFHSINGYSTQCKIALMKTTSQLRILASVMPRMENETILRMHLKRKCKQKIKLLERTSF